MSVPEFFPEVLTLHFCPLLYLGFNSANCRCSASLSPLSWLLVMADFGFPCTSVPPALEKNWPTMDSHFLVFFLAEQCNSLLLFIAEHLSWVLVAYSWFGFPCLSKSSALEKNWLTMDSHFLVFAFFALEQCNLLLLCSNKHLSCWVLISLISWLSIYVKWLLVALLVKRLGQHCTHTSLSLPFLASEQCNSHCFASFKWKLPDFMIWSEKGLHSTVICLCLAMWSQQCTAILLQPATPNLQPPILERVMKGALSICKCLVGDDYVESDSISIQLGKGYICETKSEYLCRLIELVRYRDDSTVASITNLYGKQNVRLCAT